jgi:hypothetical protein
MNNKIVLSLIRDHLMNIKEIEKGFGNPKVRRSEVIKMANFEMESLTGLQQKHNILENEILTIMDELNFAK